MNHSVRKRPRDRSLVAFMSQATPSTHAINLLSPLHERLAIATQGMPFIELGERTDTHPETVRRYIRGQQPSVAFLANLIRSAGLNAEWLLLGSGPMRQADVKAHTLREASIQELLIALAQRISETEEMVQGLERRVVELGG